MRTTRLRFGLAIAAASLWTMVLAQTTDNEDSYHWYKGNLHTHTINSDGDSSPDAVARWYKEHRYHFLALTDHNYFTDPQGLNTVFAADERFLLITGEEVTSRYEKAPLHVNAFGLNATIPPQFEDGILNTLQANIDVIRDAGAVPSLDHPLYRWAVPPEIFAKLRRLKLFEVFNGGADTNDEFGLEEMWDKVLTAGGEMYGIAIDDAHVFKHFAPAVSNPGRGWIQVRAKELSEKAILEAIERGHFYSSTGITLESEKRSNGLIDIRIQQDDDEKHRTRFIGSGGRVLKQVEGLEAQYSLKAGDGYVRASIEDSNGRRAWVQPLFEN